MPAKIKKKLRSKTLNNLGDKEVVKVGDGNSNFCNQQHFEGEGIYQGYMTNGVRQGKGKLMTSKDRFIIYNGDWSDNKPHGYGTKCFLSSGDRHEGYYINGQREGKGVYLFSNGDKYVGDWSNGLMHGHGMFSWETGDVYCGQWDKGKMTGEGIKTQSNGVRIEGAFLNGIPHGYTTKETSEGDVYCGYMKNDQRTGYGEYTWVDGTVYHGDWASDGMVGTGVIRTMDTSSGVCSSSVMRSILNSNNTRSSSGSTQSGGCNVKSYRGDFVCNSMSGLGSAERLDGSKYTGDFKSNAQTGWGRIDYEDGSVYCGDCVDGHRHGQGQLAYPAPPKLQHTHDLVVDDNNNVHVIQHPVVVGMAAAAPVAPVVMPILAHQQGLQNNNNNNPVAADDTVFNPVVDQFNFESHFNDYTLESILYQWGGSYTGCWRDDVPHGIGHVVLCNGQMFKSNFKSNAQTGWGRIDYEDGSVYCGDCVDGHRHGQGQLTYPAPPKLQHTLDLIVDDNNNVHVIQHPVAPVVMPIISHQQGLQNNNNNNNQFNANNHALVAVPVPVLALGLAPVAADDTVFNPAVDQFNFESHFNDYTLESILYQWGGSYTGCWRDDVPHGIGHVVLCNGQMFKSMFCDGKLAARNAGDGGVGGGV